MEALLPLEPRRDRLQSRQRRFHHAQLILSSAPDQESFQRCNRQSSTLLETNYHPVPVGISSTRSVFPQALSLEITWRVLVSQTCSRRGLSGSDKFVGRGKSGGQVGVWRPAVSCQIRRPPWGVVALFDAIRRRGGVFVLRLASVLRATAQKRPRITA